MTPWDQLWATVKELNLVFDLQILDDGKHFFRFGYRHECKLRYVAIGDTKEDAAAEILRQINDHIVASGTFGTSFFGDPE